ncbi:AbrB/MazE/SpoVT family DNA-binding domain-containing protein [Candidatus Woesearchaeota archaeon]|nr:AbrB/MazE/SpoVT family DNA-binding domain-containing protein [Candidatus Woesearchaeota archaeon]
MKCVLCNGKTKQMNAEHKEMGIPLGKFPAEVCEQCGETYFSEETAGKIQQKSKDMGLFGLARKATVAEIGNSIAIRIPKEIANFLKMKKGEQVTLIPEGRKELKIEI